MIATLLSKPPEHDDPNQNRVAAVEDRRDGQLLYMNPEKAVSRGEGVMMTANGVNVPNPPEGFIHVASGPKGVDSLVVQQWELYVDLERHELPESVTLRELPIEQQTISIVN